MSANGPTRAMIMAAGLGTRMRPLTNDLPKPLVKVAGKALIDHVIDRLKDAGVTEFVVNAHYKADQIKAHLAGRKDAAFIVSDESDALLDSGGGIAKALPHFKGEAFYHANADTVWVEGASHALERMIARWNPDEMDALMLLASTVNTVCYDGRGDFMMDADGRLSRVPEARIAPFVWMSLEIVHPRLFDGAPAGKFSVNPLWDKAIEKGRLHGLRLDGTWMHIDNPEAIRQSENYLADRPTR
ncbi:MAG TPA: nucleotidyltransferase family protein [Rhizomicrobium sp.]|nr:nucleotidyltransferase family protein [Rhizomicrobium sp.]